MPALVDRLGRNVVALAAEDLGEQVGEGGMRVTSVSPASKNTAAYPEEVTAPG